MHRGRGGKRAPHTTSTLWTKFFKFHTVFFGNVIKLYVGTPCWREETPSYGNPGSAPAVTGPCFNCITKMIPVVKVSSKKVKNYSRYF